MRNDMGGRESFYMCLVGKSIILFSGIYHPEDTYALHARLVKEAFANVSGSRSVLWDKLLPPWIAFGEDS